MNRSEYTPKELQEIRTILEERLDSLAHHVDDIARELKDHNPGNFADEGESASHNFEQAFEMRIRERELKLIRKVKAALSRLDDGSYGSCTECEQWISHERLKARPVAELCIECKEEQEYLEKLITDQSS